MLALLRQEIVIKTYVNKHRCHLWHTLQTRFYLNLALVPQRLLTTGLGRRQPSNGQALGSFEAL